MVLACMPPPVLEAVRTRPCVPCDLGMERSLPSGYRMSDGLENLGKKNITHTQLAGLQKCSWQHSQSMMRRRLRGCRVPLRHQVSLMVTPILLLLTKPTAWNATPLGGRSGCWFLWEEPSLCISALYPILIRWTVARDAWKCKVMRDNYGLCRCQRLKLQ